MNLKSKSHILGKHFVSKFALNTKHNILAVYVDSADTVSFYHLANSQPQEIFQGMSKPSGKKSALAWSNDGAYLALGSNNLEIWKFDGKKMNPVKNYSEDFFDVKIVSWSPDSVSVAYGGLSRKNCIKIKNIQTGVTKDLAIPLAVCSISFDPFGKYLLLLLRNNILYIYNASNLSKVKEVPLSPNTNKKDSINTVRDIRGMGWSPDFNYIVCPSLDDSKVSVAVNLSRSGGFRFKQGFLGHVSSISCAKFNPNLYQHDKQVGSILALGDSHGLITLWRISKTNSSQPLLLINSNTDYNEVVDDLEWSQSGQTLIVNAMKRYINVYVFDKSKFGRQISLNEKTNIIEASYGVTSASEIHHKKLEVFSLNTLQETIDKVDPESQNKKIELPQKNQEKSILTNVDVAEKSSIFEPTSKLEYVKMNEQVTLKGKNQKKRIQPAVLVRKDELPKQNQPSSQFPQSSSHLYSTVGSYQPLNLKPISCDQQMIKISKHSYIQLRKIQGYTIIKLLEHQNGDKVVTNERVFTNTIDWIKIGSDRMYLLNMGNLYIFGLKLNLTNLPYNLGQIHKIVVNESADVYYITTKGLIKGFNYEHKICYTPVPVALQCLIEGVKWKPSEKGKDEEKDEEYVSIVDSIAVENDHNIYVNLCQKKSRYFYCRNTQCWITLDLNSGLLQPGDSLKIGQQQQKISASFFHSLTHKFIPSTFKTTQTPLQQFQSNMVYYRLHNPNRQLYLQNLMGMLKELKIRNQLDKLRSQIVKYFIDEKSECYQKDENLKKKVREIGGNVIQQFILFNQL